VTIEKLEREASKKPAGDSSEVFHERLPTVTQFFRDELEQPQSLDGTYVTASPIKNQSENAIVDMGANIPSNSVQSKDTSQFNVENAAHLAADLMKRLGYEQSQFPTKVYLDGENNVVELSLQNGTARVQIDTKTREVKEYEVQETEMQQGFFTAKRKAVLLFLFSISAVIVVLKLLNIF